MEPTQSVAAKGDPGTGWSEPSCATANDDTAELNVSGVSRSWLLGVSVSALMVLVPPLGNGEPGTGVKLPSAAMSKASMRFDPALETNTRLLAQVLSIATAGPLVRNGEPETGVSAPLASIEYTPRASNDRRPTRRKLPLAVTFRPSGSAPVSKGEPAASVITPFAAMLKVRINVELSST